MTAVTLPFAGDSSRRRELVAASTAGTILRRLSLLTWHDLTYCTTLPFFHNEDNVEECHQCTSESSVGSWQHRKTDGQRSVRESKVNYSLPHPHPLLFLPSLSPLRWQWCVGLSISLSQASAAVTGGARHSILLRFPLPPAATAIETTCGQAIDARQSKRDAVRSVSRWHAVVIDKTVHGWRRVVTSCMRVTLPPQPASRVICRARLPSFVRRRTAAGWGISPMNGRTRRSIRSAGNPRSPFTRRVCMYRSRMSTSASIQSVTRRAMTR